MNAEKAVEYANKGCMLFYFTLILMVCGSALGIGLWLAQQIVRILFCDH